jgi:hypothetical protein
VGLESVIKLGVIERLRMPTRTVRVEQIGAVVNAPLRARLIVDGGIPVKDLVAALDASDSN